MTTPNGRGILDRVAGEVTSRKFSDWPPEVTEELVTNEFNGRVGQTLLAETPESRVWEIRLQPGERLPIHRHVLHYQWFVVSAGQGRQHLHDGSTREVVYEVGDCRYFTFGKGEYLLHDLQNTGDTVLAFTTVEILHSENAPLPI